MPQNRTRKAKIFLIDSIKRPLIRILYEFFALFSVNEIKFMNYGIAMEGAVKIDKADENEKLQMQLYQYVTQYCELDNKDILEIGCGRGGGCYFISKYYQPKTLTGIDMALGNIRRASKKLNEYKIHFAQGDAENLEFGDKKFDVILNVESSHCYVDMEKFVSGVHHYLKPGGYFCFCDLGTPGRFLKVDALFKKFQFELIQNEDINQKILQSMDEDNERKLRLLKKYPSLPFIRKFVKDNLGVKDTLVYNNFASGKMVYKYYLLKRN